MATITASRHDQELHSGRSLQPTWSRILLLFVLGYEAAGALLGGALLIAAPDGRLMDMPVELMRGFFPDFLIPGIILLGLGLLKGVFTKLCHAAKKASPPTPLPRRGGFCTLITH